MKLGRWLLALAAVLGILGIAGNRAMAQDIRQDLAATSVIEEIKKRGVLRVGLSTFVPWAMRDKEGKLIGFEIDVANKLAEDMGVTIESVPTSWDGIIPALLAGKFDVIISGMSTTPSRNLTVNFTNPYANTETVIVANKAMAGSFKTLEDFNEPEITIADRRGATTATLAQKIWPKATHLLFDEEGQSLQELLNGKAHAVLASVPSPALWIEQYPDVLFVPDIPALEKTVESFALRKGDPDALNFFNNWILVNTVSGWLGERHSYWFKGRAWKDQVPEQ